MNKGEYDNSSVSQREKIKLPVIEDASAISIDDLKILMEIGFCYIKLPQNDRYEASFNTVYQRGLSFFRQPKGEKMKAAFDQTLIAGYADRRDGEKPMRLEQFFCRPNKLIGPLESPDLKEPVEEVTKLYQEKIAIPVLKQILTYLGLENHYQEMSEGCFSSISFPYYPEDVEGRYSEEVTAHKDFDLMTVLAINKPGLQVYADHEWHDVLPKTGYVVLNLANTLELMTSGKCKSALHRVMVPERDKDRMSFGLFIGLGMEKPVVNLVTHEQLYPTAKDCLMAQLTHYGFDDLEESKKPDGILKL